jgi:hypothetical protein
MKLETKKRGDGVCHKTAYERSAALRAIAVSSIWKDARFCPKCRAFHLTRERV